MEAVKEALKKRASGSIGQALHYEAQAKQLRTDADKYDAEAKTLRAEAAEFERLIELVYGK